MNVLKALLVLSLLPAVFNQTQAEELPYTLERSEARILSANEYLKVAFGPVRFIFPTGWSLGQERNPWKASGPNRAVAWVSVLSATESSLRSGMLTPQRLERAKDQLSSSAGNLCTTSGVASVSTILLTDQKAIFVAGCEERRGSEVQFGLRYEIYSPTGLVQLIAAGNGSFFSGRELFDSIAH
jgi:hypothetical protein